MLASGVLRIYPKNQLTSKTPRMTVRLKVMEAKGQIYVKGTALLVPRLLHMQLPKTIAGGLAKELLYRHKKTLYHLVLQTMAGN